MELIIVIIIVGILATVGLNQYTKMVDRGRQSEAITILGNIRKNIKFFYLQNGKVDGITNTDIDIGTSSGQIPSACDTSHYFSYGIYYVSTASQKVEIRANRCTSGGKAPQGSSCYIWWLIYPQSGVDVAYENTCS